MSSIYIQEPPTNGKVLLKTSVGDIDLELWSKETPKACQNFIQLCLEGYYNDTIFHRVVKDFIVQGGDPTGTGTGGESAFGTPFKDEFHSRLRFNRRGLVAMANAGRDENGSQFFFTLAATPELQNKHTIFGKVTRETIFNMIKLQDTLVKDERPLYPHKILKMEVLFNPFSDIVPRVLPIDEGELETRWDVKTKEKRCGVKNFKLLSFGEEAEEEEEANFEANKIYSGRSKSTHDLLNDPKLSPKPAIVTKSRKRHSKEMKEDKQNNDTTSEMGDLDKDMKYDKKDAEGRIKQESSSKEDEEIEEEEIEEEENNFIFSVHEKQSVNMDTTSRESHSVSGKQSEVRIKREIEDVENGKNDSYKNQEKGESSRQVHVKSEEDESEEDQTLVDEKSRGPSRKRTTSRDSEDSSDLDLSGDEDMRRSSDSSHSVVFTVLCREMERIKKKLKTDKHSGKSKHKTKTSEPDNVHEDGNKPIINVEDEERGVKANKTSQSKLASEYHQKYKVLKSTLLRAGKSREDFTMGLLAKFQTKLAYAKDKVDEVSESSDDDPNPNGAAAAAAATTTTAAAAANAANDDNWLSHKLYFQNNVPNPAKDASTKTDDWFEIYDPRNPINKRRREASREALKVKERW